LPPRLASLGGIITISRVPATPRSLVGRLPERACPHPWGGAWGTNASEAVTAASSCCGLATAVVTRDSSPTAAGLAAVCGTLSERRPVIMDVLTLSALTGVREGTVDVTLSTKEEKV
jgi:hypothetical protein